jgi:hypothetical protein
MAGRLIFLAVASSLIDPIPRRTCLNTWNQYMELLDGDSELSRRGSLDMGADKIPERRYCLPEAVDGMIIQSGRW